jgi:exonuclease III
MKLISLNTWGGRAGKDIFLDFFRLYQDVDIFCLQEVWSGGEEMAGVMAGGRVTRNILHTLLSDVTALLPNHQPFFRISFRDYYGLAIFVKKGITVREEGDTFVYKDYGFIAEGDPGDHARNMQYIAFDTQRGPRTVLNFHGMWKRGLGKHDTLERVEQSERIVSFLHTVETPLILCGDFNLVPDTESMKMLETTGLRNLTREHDVVSTRTSLYDKPEKRDMAIDHILVSPEIRVKEFMVLPQEVSDHNALLLHFD